MCVLIYHTLESTAVASRPGDIFACVAPSKQEACMHNKQAFVSSLYPKGVAPYTPRIGWLRAQLPHNVPVELSRLLAASSTAHRPESSCASASASWEGHKGAALHAPGQPHWPSCHAPGQSRGTHRPRGYARPGQPPGQGLEVWLSPLVPLVQGLEVRPTG